MALRKPIAPDAKFGRVDQGVDYSQKDAYKAVGAGVVTKITHNVVGGTNTGIYYRLDHPITINGRRYQELYIWHTTPLVNVGDRVKAGTPLMTGGSAELGFAENGSPVAPLEGGLGAGTKASQAGQDFLAFAKKGANQTPDYSKGNALTNLAAAQTGASGAPPTPVYAPPSPPPPTAIGLPGPSVPTPGGVDSAVGARRDDTTSLWNQVAQGDFISPETQAMLRNAQMATGLQ